MDSRLHRLCGALALSFAVSPLWVTQNLPMVDLPQHLYLISVLHRLGDPTTLYPEFFALRGQLTPYLGYYHAVSLLNWLLPLPIANQLFLSAYVIGFPLSLAFLLKSLGRATWPCWLSLPFAYGDSFAWGFVNYCSALPLAFLCCGFIVRAIAYPRRSRWSVGLALSLVAVLLSHVQVFAFLAIALPALLLMTRAPEDAAARKLPLWNRTGRLLATRWAALIALVPGVALFAAWVIARLGQPAEVQFGEPWKAWGPLLSSSNLSFKSFAQNRGELTEVLANMLRDGSDRYALFAVGGVAAAAILLAIIPRTRQRSAEGPWERWRLVVLASSALLLYFALPFDIRGYMYYLNTRYAHLAAPLLICAVPSVRPSASRLLLVAAAAASVILGISLARGFSKFGDEARLVEELSWQSAPRAKVMGLIFNPFSGVVRHPVFLHSAATLAREHGGIPNFTFASTPHSPIRYRGEPPPTFPSEWRPDQLNYAQQGRFYDHFLLRGADPIQVFGAALQTELVIAGRAQSFWLLKRRDHGTGLR
ncbi:MAG TPA: hypothetical protein VKE49_08160 [Myxococcaceae bacterium]|nr:hypothetical protein [Myxococcaceae bacterium]